MLDEEETASGKLQLLSSEPIFGFWIDLSGNIYTVLENGAISRLSQDGKLEPLSEQSIPSISSVNPSSDGLRTIISFGYPTKESFSVFDTKTNRFIPLSEGTSSADWHPSSSDRLVYIQNRGEKNVISTFTVSSQKSSELITLSQKGLRLDWASPEEIYLFDLPDNKSTGSLWTLNISTKTLRPIIKEESGLMTKWFSNNSFGLKLSFVNQLPSLEIIDQQNRTLAKLPFVGLPSECAEALSENRIYCAIPDAQDNLNGFLRRYLKKEDFYADSVYAIPTNIGIDQRLENAVMPISSPALDANVDISELSAYNGDLYFINRADRLLYRLDL